MCEYEDSVPLNVNGFCEDYPCCGHELGDCFGQKYGSDEDIKAQAYRQMKLEDEGIFQDQDYC